MKVKIEMDLDESEYDPSDIDGQERRIGLVCDILNGLADLPQKAKISIDDGELKEVQLY